MKKRTILAIAGIALMAGGCKTTVGNYQEAYDIAIKKQIREDSLKASRKSEMGMGDIVMEEDADGARLMHIGGRDVRTLNVYFAKADSLERFSPAVGFFKMPANASAFVADLKAEGWSEARMAKGAERYYVLLGTYSDAETAIRQLDSYLARNPGRKSVGLHTPLICVWPLAR